MILVQTFAPLLFDPKSVLYKTTMSGQALVFTDAELFLEKLDVMMNVVNLYRYLAIRDKNRDYGVITESNQQEWFETYFIPLQGMLKQVQELLLTDCKLAKDIQSSSMETFTHYQQSLSMLSSIIHEYINPL
jgi:hypothetical protein